jgi:hypothetical protein
MEGTDDACENLIFSRGPGSAREEAPTLLAAKVSDMNPLVLQRPARFRAEADMLAPLAASAATFAKRACVLFEVPCTAGIPDIVLLELDGKAVAERVGTEPLTEPVDVRLVLAMAAIRDPTSRSWTVDDLASGAGVSAAHLRRLILPRLIETGHVVAGEGGWSPAYRFRSLARRIVTIEAKLRDWRGGVAQASRHTAVADAAWVAIDARSAGTAANHPEWFTTYGIGLVAVSSSGTVEPLITPGPSRTRQPGRELLAERAAALHLSGQVSGPLPRVFGQTLIASTGVDPRLTGAGAR